MKPQMNTLRKPQHLTISIIDMVSSLTQRTNSEMLMHDLLKAYKTPSHGQIHETRRCAKVEIKHAIRNKKSMDDD